MFQQKIHSLPSESRGLSWDIDSIIGHITFHTPLYSGGGSFPSLINFSFFHFLKLRLCGSGVNKATKMLSEDGSRQCFGLSIIRLSLNSVS